MKKRIVMPCLSMVQGWTAALQEVTLLIDVLDGAQVPVSAASLIELPDEWPQMRRDEIPAINYWISQQPALARFFDEDADKHLAAIDPDNVLKHLAIQCALATVAPTADLQDLAKQYNIARLSNDSAAETEALRSFLRLANQLMLAQDAKPV